MDITVDILKGEGERKTIIKIRTRRKCEICGEPAHYKHTFLLNGTRSNPNSKAYRKDNCSWCEDERIFTCKEHLKETESPPEGYVFCSTFSASERFSHMFLYWEEQEVDMDIYKCEKCEKIFDEFEMDFKFAQEEKATLCEKCKKVYLAGLNKEDR